MPWWKKKDTAKLDFVSAMLPTYYQTAGYIWIHVKIALFSRSLMWSLKRENTVNNILRMEISETTAI